MDNDSAIRLNAKWVNGSFYACNYAHCSNCGRMQLTGWDSHAEAKREIVDFHKDYRYCPSCGSRMVGYEYHE